MKTFSVIMILNIFFYFCMCLTFIKNSSEKLNVVNQACHLNFIQNFGNILQFKGN